MTLRSTGQHLAELPGLLVRYEWPDTHCSPDPTPQAEGGRILFAWSAASSAVPAAEHQEAIVRACQAGFLGFDLERDVLLYASCGRLARVLAEAARSGPPIRVLHLLCHGAAQGSTFGLCLNADGEGASQSLIVDPGRLRNLLAPYAGMLRLVVLCACDGGNSGALGNQLGSVAQTLHRAGLAAVVASRYPLSVDGSVHWTQTMYEVLLSRPDSLEQAFLAARRRLAEDAGQLDWASLQLYARSADGPDSRPLAIRPYRGLLHFDREHRRFFFGREREVADIVERMRSLRAANRPRLLAVDGSSGSGKSSVVQAGAVAELLKLHGPDAVLLVRRPGSEPLHVFSDLPTEKPALLIIDQFEELFTHTPDSQEGRLVRTDFARRLWNVVTASSRVSVVLTVRSDFIGRCGELLLEDGQRLDSVLYKPEHRVSIAQLDRVRLREIIERPANLVGLELEAGLCERLLTDVETEPGALPLLADTLDSLWLARRGRTLLQAAYDALGGIAGTLTGRAEQVLASLDAPELRIARRLLVRLVAIGEDGGQRTRRRVTLDQVQPAEAADAARLQTVLTRLCDARLVIRGQLQDRGEQVIEVAHEALLRRWPRLGQWLDEDQLWLQRQQRLQQWAQEYKDHESLLRGHQLQRAREWVENRTEDLSAAVIELLKASEAAQAQQEEAARLARDSRRVLAAQQLDFDPTRAAMLLREVESQNPLRVPGWLSRVSQILQREVMTLCELNDPGGSIERVCISPDMSMIATSSTEGSLRLWEGAAGQLLAVAPRPPGRLLDLAFCSDGSLVIATAVSGQKVQLLTLEPGAKSVSAGRLLCHPALVRTAVFGKDTSVLAIGNDAGEVWLATRKGGDEPTALGTGGKGKGAAHQGAVTALCFSAKGDCLASAGRDGKVLLWELTGKQPPRKLIARPRPEEAEEGDDLSDPCALAFHPAGTYVAIGQVAGGVLVVRRDAQREPLYLKGHDYRVTGLAFSPDGRLLCSTSVDGVAGLWGFPAPGRLAWLAGHRGVVNDGAFSSDGTRLITGGTDGVARIWDLTRGALDAAVPLAAKEKPPATFVRCFWRPEIEVLHEEPQRPTLSEHRDGPRVARADAQGTVVVTLNGKPVATLPGQGAPATALAFSADGSKLAIAQRDRTVRLWELASGRLTCLVGHHDECYSLAFHPDGTLLATGSVDFTVRLWRTDPSGALVRVLTQNGEVTLVLFSPDGSLVATASEDDGLWLWDLDGTRLPLIDPERGEYCVAVRRDLGACITMDGTLDTEDPDEAERFIWPLELDPASLIARLWRVSTICLSPAERRQFLGETEAEAEKNYLRSLSQARTAAASAPPAPPRAAPPAPSWDGEEEGEDD